VDEYLKIKPMLTPAVAGMATMTITSALVDQFGLTPSITALLIAFLIGTVALSDTSVPILQRGVFYLINSITIFSVAVGINQTAVGMMKTQAQYQYEQRWVPPEGESAEGKSSGFLRSWF